MSGDESRVDRFTDGTSVRWGALASTVVGTLAYAYVKGLIGWIVAVPGGVVRAIGRLGTWVADGVVAEIFDALSSSMHISGNALRGSFIHGLMAELGPLAAPVAVIASMLLLWGMMETIDTAATIVRDS